MSVLTLERVSKRFDQVLAVDDLSFAVATGSVFGFLGGNGAGKTTSLRMVLDIIRPTSGRIEVLGRAPGRANAPDIGFLPEERGLYRQMTALDTIAYFGRLKGMAPADAKREGAALLDRFGLAANSKMTVDKLSKGMAQKVQLATALVNRPRLLILDEPFSGLDPVNQGLLEEEIRRMSATGSTVVFSTHVMQHAERLCDRLLLLAKGRKKFEGTLEEARCELPARLALIARNDPSKLAGVESAEDRRRGRARLAPVGRASHTRNCPWRPARALRRRAIPAAALRTISCEPPRRVRPHRRLGGGALMNKILLVAAREFRQIAGMRSFWLTLLIIPLSLVIGAITPQLIDKDEPDRVMIIDQSGGDEGHALEQRLKRDQDQKALNDLSRYVQRHHLEKADPAALWSQHDRWYGDADIQRFIAEGGVAVGQGENRAGEGQGHA